MHEKRVKESKSRAKSRRGIDGAMDDFQESFNEGMIHMTPKRWLAVVFFCLVAFVVVKYRVDLMGVLNINPRWAFLMWLVPLAVIMTARGGSGKTEQDQFESIGLTNSLGESPELISKEKDKKNPNVEIRTYDSQSIPVQRWYDAKDRIEAAFDCSVTFIEQGKNKQEVVIGFISSDKKVPGMIEWKDEFTPGFGHKETDTYRSKGKLRDKLHEMNKVDEGVNVLAEDDGFTVNLGESIEGPVLVDLNSQPHMLIGGTTGSGKSVELRTIMWQCVLKGAKIFILDFKGGLEFSAAWERYSQVYCQPDEAFELLENLFTEMDARNTLFKKTSEDLYRRGIKADCKNIEDYNRLNPDKPLARIVLACDEIAQVLMTNKAADKEEKAVYAGINDRMQRLAQLSRASGIHMILATQRPDAKLIDGQIRTNVDLRICGRVGRPSESEIVLNGDPIAATISKRQKGRFFTNANGITQMQGYWFQDSKHMSEGDYLIGETLLMDSVAPKTAKEYEPDTEQEMIDDGEYSGEPITDEIPEISIEDYVR